MIKKFEEYKEEPEVKIDYYKNGQKKYEKWYLNNKFHREDGPAIQDWYKNGQKMYEKWCLNDKFHREDGPAIQWWWYSSVQKEFEEWFLNDKQYSREKWIEKLKDIGSEHYEEQKMLYDAEKYNL